MALTFKPVVTDDDIALTAKTADEIWHEYWPDRIGLPQTDYMVNTMQSVGPLTHDIREVGYRYWLLYDEDGELVGYTGSLPEDYSAAPDSPEANKHGDEITKRATKRLFISKIYLYANQRGKHYSSRVVEFYEDLCRAEGLAAMYLTVNRENDIAIRAYLGRGFETIQVIDADIGDGFTMYDYIMCKMVPQG